MKRIFIAIASLSLAVWQALAQVPANQKRGDSDSMNRIDRAKLKYQELFGPPQTVANSPDPELMSILQSFIFGEVFYIGNLDDKTRELITITVLTTNQTLPQLTAHTNAALNIGVTPIEIREVVYQTAPFIGFPKVLNALDTINGFLKAGTFNCLWRTKEPLRRVIDLKKEKKSNIQFTEMQ